MFEHWKLDRDKKVILIVDDSVENLKLLTGLLKDSYKIKIAKHGQKAVEIVKSNPNIQLILMDIMMPIMNGIEACQLIKTDPSTRHIPIIFLTGLKSTDHETDGFAAGAADFITKPFNACLLYTSPSPRDATLSRMPSSA